MGNTPQNIQRYHLTIQDLVSGETQGFILNAGKDGKSISFSYQSLAPLMLKTQQGEITMGDLTNTSVFVQFNRAGQQVDQFTQVPIGPRGYKFWVPRYIYGNFLPTQVYWYGQGVDTTSQAGEIKLTSAAVTSLKLLNGDIIGCREIDGTTLYVGSKYSGKVYSSTDKGLNWTLLYDFAAEIDPNYNQVRQLMIVKDKKCKKLAIVLGTLGVQGMGNLYTRTLSDTYGFDLVKDYSGNFFDSNTDFEGRYPDAPASIQLHGIASVPSFTYTSIDNAVTGGTSADYYVTVAKVKGNQALLITGINADMLLAIQYVNTVGFRESTTGTTKANILCFNNTLVPITYEFNDGTGISIPVGGLLINYISYDTSSTVYHAILTNNHIHMASTTGLECGMILDTSSGKLKIVSTSSNLIVVNNYIPTAELAYAGGTFDITTDSYGRVFALSTYIEGHSLLGTKFVTPAGTTFTIVEEYSQDTIGGPVTNQRTTYAKNNRTYYAPGRCLTTPLVVVADRNIGTTSKVCQLQRLQKCGSSIENHNIIQLVKLGYDETKSQAESYIGAIVYYTNDKIPYQMIPLQLLSTKDNRLRDYTTGYLAGDYLYNEYQNYYNSNSFDISYLCEKKYMTQGFDKDVPTAVAGYPISVAFDDTTNISYFSTYQAIGGDTITIRKSSSAGVEKEIDIPGVGYATGLCYGNIKLFFTSAIYGHVYQYGLSAENSYNKTFSVAYQTVNLNGLATTNNQIGAIYNGSYVMISNTDGVAYAYDTLDPSCPFSEKFNIEYIGTTHYTTVAMIPLGSDLLIQSGHGELYRWNRSNALVNRGFLVSSNYGIYLGSINKNRIQTRIILNDQSIVGDKGQKIRFAVSFDYGKTFNYIAKVQGKPFLPDNFSNPIGDTDYEQSYFDFGGVNKNELVFWYPYSAITKIMCYKIELYAGGSLANELVVNHIENHYVVQSFKELFLNLSIDLRPRVRTLDGSIEQSPSAHRDKLAFLKQIWTEQRKCQIKLPRGDVYYGIPFAMPNTGNDGFGVTAMDLAPGKKDVDLFTYAVQMSFKTIT